MIGHMECYKAEQLNIYTVLSKLQFSQNGKTVHSINMQAGYVLASFDILPK